MKTVYIITDANGDFDSCFLVDGELAEEDFKKLQKRLGAVGHSLDIHAPLGDAGQLRKRVSNIEEDCR